ncbi:hypothetical protein C8E89_12843 [Mycolicibacterium moriokaense]|uniref:Uncharacterized protein n=1 Tax=Mycolicibacterium moriokaense TaxID=39691 RepID=A0A318H7Z3_9MYCO|nr:hypothetical protein C8E89_12843 [Mycolicibacterium moriokaense]
MENQRLKWQAVVIAASVLVVLGALATAIDQEQTAAAGSGNMNMVGKHEYWGNHHLVDDTPGGPTA